jgi:hypothetical protein
MSCRMRVLQPVQGKENAAAAVLAARGDGVLCALLWRRSYSSIGLLKQCLLPVDPAAYVGLCHARFARFAIGACCSELAGEIPGWVYTCEV